MYNYLYIDIIIMYWSVDKAVSVVYTKRNLGHKIHMNVHVHVCTWSLCRTYQLFQPFYEPAVLESVALDNHSHTVTATGSKGMSMFVVCEDLSLVSHQGTTPACVLDHHATENKKKKTFDNAMYMYHTRLSLDLHLQDCTCSCPTNVGSHNFKCFTPFSQASLLGLVLWPPRNFDLAVVSVATASHNSWLSSSNDSEGHFHWGY